MTVLVAYNDSPQGEAALRAASAEATRRKTGLAVMVLTPQSPGAAIPPGLAHLIDALPTGLGNPEIMFRDEDVDPADAILDLAEEISPDLVVIGARKRSPVGKFLLGSTTQRVLLDAPAPVMVIKAQH